MAGPHRVTQVDVVILYLVSLAHPNVEYQLEQAVCAGVEADFNAGLEGGRAVTVRYVLPIDLAYGTAPTVKAVKASELTQAVRQLEACLGQLVGQPLYGEVGLFAHLGLQHMSTLGVGASLMLTATAHREAPLRHVDDSIPPH